MPNLLFSLRSAGLFLSALALLVLSLGFGAAIGETAIPVATVFKTIANHLWGAGYPVDLIDSGIVWNYRLSRAAMAACCGASLAICGVILQALLRNALADPYILGLSAGASAGAVSVAVWGTGIGMLSFSAGAFTGALLAFVFVIFLAARAGYSTAAIILAGVAGAQLFNALTALIITKSVNAEQARGIMFWLLGNLSGVRWTDITLALPVTLIGFLVCLWHARALDAFAFGACSAAALGICVRRISIILIGICALQTAVMVSLVGAIGFVGLVIPHSIRFITGSRHYILIPAAAMTGAVFLILCDIVSRIIIAGQVLPIGVITALVGAPAFALILCHGKVFPHA